METILAIFEQAPAWVTALTALVTGVSAITAITPSTSDNAIVAKILKGLNFLALNVFKNKNADDK